MSANDDWNKVLEAEDRIIDNSDRKHRYHFNSLEGMSEELVYRESMARQHESDPADSLPDDSFISRVKDKKLVNALRKLTKKQLQVIELAFWEGYKQEDIADMIGCSQSSVSERLSNALKRLAEYLDG